MIQSIKPKIMDIGRVILIAAVLAIVCEAKSLSNNKNDVSAVIPSPNQEFGDEIDIQRVGLSSASPPATQALVMPVAAVDQQELAEPSNEASVPVYASPFNRAQIDAVTLANSVVPSKYEHRQESSHAPPNYVPNPSASNTSGDLKTSASYGHNHHGGHYGHDHSGWLDMGAWTGGKGSFGWYADYPVGGKHHGYGRK